MLEIGFIGTRPIIVFFINIPNDFRLDVVLSFIKDVPSSSITKIVGDPDSAFERPERPSPVSVLEPLFTEDKISPASIKFQPDELPMQPLRIPF
ncbi:uncharacterized protein LOC130793070 [Actinidia eriantha]|uniref:uncharacterized protein LOC130793070 n=1 Tax=Actinidia eriantha TaxID=165200 RepID=UPI00258D6F16|nr:uncharacterized protein LOC130793070 [Actinidia eriantha]